MEYKRYPYDYLHKFSFEVMKKLGISEEDAHIPGEALLKADLMGDPSHGIIRLKRYTWRLDNNLINRKPKMSVTIETPSFISYDADNGLGQVAGYKAMNLCMDKAMKSGIAIAHVRRTNHIGKCGYYSMLALKRDMIGISMMNASCLVAPTFGIEPLIGTNPMALAAPAGKEPPFCLDMATSVRAYGRVDIRNREGREIPLGWGLDHEGKVTIHPKDILGTAGYAKSGGQRGTMLPLGGFGDETAGYKGYGLALVVDILTGVLAGGLWGENLALGLDEKVAGLTHLVGAINIEAFRPLNEFKKDMDAMMRKLKDSKKARGYDYTCKQIEDGYQITMKRRKEPYERIYVPGERGLELEKEQMKNGVRLGDYVIKELEAINEQYDMGYKF
jgi:LDH2 family malate/lactate/ureidoglycolate dehydrogenase